MFSNVWSKLANSLPVRFGYFTKDGQNQKVIFYGHEKAIFGSDGVTLDEKLGNVKKSISDAFDEEKTYVAGEYCIYNNELQKFTATKEPGPWDALLASPVSISDELKSVRERTYFKARYILDDCNNATEPGFCKGFVHLVDTKNNPGLYGYIFNLVSHYPVENMTQFFVSYGTSTDTVKLAVRCRFDGVWSAWRII